jgi:hypothetical protein
MLRLALCFTLLVGSTALANSNNLIPFHKKIELKVGQSMVVNGYRGACGKRPKNVDKKRTRSTKTGILSIGKWGVRNSGKCGGLTPAIEVIFKATKRGRETIEVDGSKIRVTVK